MNQTNNDNINSESIKKEEHTTHSKHTSIIAKILCVFAAFCLWVYVMMVESPEYEETFSHIVVDLVNTDELISEHDLAIYNGYGTMIDVTLSGKKSVLSKLTDRDIVATADVGGVTEGGSRYNCKITVDVPAGCSLVGMSQETLSVYIDKASSISVDLTEIRDNTRLPEGCYTGLIEFPVDKVTVTGPTKILDTVNRAVVLIDLTGVKKTEIMTRDVYLADKNGNRIDSPYIDYYPREVTFEVPVIKSVDVPVEVLFKYGFLNRNNTKVTVTPSEIEVTGDPSVINKGNLIEPIEIDEKLDFDGLIYEATYRLDSADGVTLSATEVKVTAEIDPAIMTREISVPKENIIDSGAKEGVRYSIDRSATIVTLMGELGKISAVNPEDITLEIDMSPYSVTNKGTIKVRARVIIDSEYKDDIIEIGSYNIDVTFEN